MKLAAVETRTAPDAVESLLREVRALTVRVERLERVGAPRDLADTTLREAIATSTGRRVFTANELLRHSQVDLDLAAAMRAADVVSVMDIGCWLRDRRGVADGIAVVRRGRRWQVVHMMCSEEF